MTVWVVEFDCEDDYHEVVGVYANEDLATTARLERAAEEDEDADEFSVSIEEFEVFGI
jgi:hypothetical protein